MNRIKVIIMGAAGRDFHNFNVFFRDNPKYDVIAFTAAQIPRIDGKVYPPVLAGKLYPLGTPIDLRKIIKINKPSVGIGYELNETSKPDIEEIVTRRLLN